MVETGRKYVFDFDSTLTRVEALDVLAEMTLQNNPKRDEIVSEIQKSPIWGLMGIFPLQNPWNKELSCWMPIRAIWMN